MKSTKNYKINKKFIIIMKLQFSLKMTIVMAYFKKLIFL